MKNLFAFSILLATLASCQPKASDLSYHINGSTTDSSLNGKNVYLRDRSEMKMMDSTTVVDGKFTFKGEAPNHMLLQVLTEKYSAAIIQEKEVINVELGRPSVVTGGKLNQQLISIEDSVKNMQNAIMTKLRGNNELTDEEKAAMYNEFISSAKKLYRDALTNNTDNMLGVLCVNYLLMGEESLEALDSLISKVPLASKYTPIIEAREALVHRQKTANGKMFVDFKGKTIEGKDVSLSDYVGKGDYVLVDFWASWCGPCLAEIPNLKNVYNKYKGKGFKLVGVNVWDKKPNFTKSLEEKDMKWDHIYASDNNDATDKYGIKGIPTIILFAPDGKIVNRTLRGQEIGKALAEIYGE